MLAIHNHFRHRFVESRAKYWTDTLTGNMMYVESDVLPKFAYRACTQIFKTKLKTGSDSILLVGHYCRLVLLPDNALPLAPPLSTSLCLMLLSRDIGPKT